MSVKTSFVFQVSVRETKYLIIIAKNFNLSEIVPVKISVNRSFVKVSKLIEVVKLLLEK